MTGMYDNTQPELWDAVDTYGETYGLDVFVTEHESQALLLGPDGLPLRYEDPQPIGFVLRGSK